MSSVDNRVVNMTFNNAQFEKGVRQTTDSINNLKSNLNTLSQQKGMENVTQSFGSLKGAVDSVSFQNIASGISDLQQRFSTMGIVGMTIVSDLTNSFLGLGSTIKENLIDPIVSGGWSRASNIEKAEFQINGLGKDWQALHKDMEYAVDGTAYGLDSAASAAGQLSASGVEAGDDMKTALRGISGVAAMTGSSYEDISRIFTQVAGNGRLMGDQLLEVSSRGINAAAVLAKYLGTDEATVREMVSKGQIDFKTFADAMDAAFGEHAKDANKTFTGAMSNVHAAMSKIGADFEGVLISSDDFNNGLANLISIANGYRNVLNALRTALKPVAADFANTFRAIATVVTNGLNSMFEVVQDSDGNNITQFVEPLRNAFTNIRESIKNVSDFIFSIAGLMGKAWNSIFPPVTFQTIEKITASIEKLTEALPKVTDLSKTLYDAFGIDLTNGFMKNAYSVENLKSGYNGIQGSLKATNQQVSNSEKFFSNLQSTFSGVFAVADIVKKAIGDIGQILKTFVMPVITGLGEIIFAITGTIGDWLTVLDKIIPGVDTFGTDVGKLSDFLSPLGNLLTNVKDFIVDFIDALKPGVGTVDAITSKIDEFKESLSPLGDILDNGRDKVKAFLDSLSLDKLSGTIIGSNFGQTIKNIFSGIWSVISGVGSKIGNALKNLFSEIASAFDNLNFTDINKFMGLIQQGSFAGGLAVLAESCYKAVYAVKDIASLPGVFKSLLSSITTFTNQLTATFKAFAAQIDVQMFKAIAISIAILVGSLWLLSSIDAASLATSTGVIVALMKALVQCADDMKQIGNNSFSKTATSLVIFSVAILILCSAMKKISELSIEQTIQGVAAVGLLGLGLWGFAKLMSKVDTKGFTKTAVGMVIFAVAIKILASAVGELGNLNTDQLIKGLLSVGALLLGISLFLSKTDFSGMSISKAAGILLVAASIKILAGVVNELGSIDINTLVQGLVGVGTLLFGIAVFMNMIGDSSMDISSAVALAVTAGSLLILANVIQQIGSMDTNTFVQGLAGIAIALTELTVALNLLDTSIGGAMALLITAAALNVLVPVIQSLGSMSLDAICTALIALGGSLLVLSLGLAMMAETGPGCLALLAAAVALAILTPVLQSLGGMSLDSVCTALLMLAGAFMVIAVGAALLTPMIGTLIIFAAAIALIGVAVFAAGAGLAMLSTSLPMLAVGLSELAAVDAGAILAVGLAVGAAGLGMLVGAPGILLFGLGAALLAVGIGALAGSSGSMPAIAEGLNSFSSINGAALLINGAALVVFGAGAIVAGAGLLILGVASLLMPNVVSGLNGLSQIDGVALGVTGLALLAASPGFLAFGAAAVILGVGMILLSAVAPMIPIICVGLQMFSAIDGIAIAAAGVGMLAAAPGLLLFGAAALIAGVGILALSLSAPMLPIIAIGLQSVSLIDGAALALAGAGLLIFGAAALVAGVGIMLLGTSALMLPVIALGLMQLSMVDGGMLAIIAVALIALGAGALVGGAGLLVLGAGANLAGSGLILLASGILLLEAVLSGLIPQLDSAGSSAVNGLAGGISNAGSIAVGAIGTIGSGILSAITSGLSSIGGIGSNAISALGGAISGAVGYAISAASGIGNAIMSGIRSSISGIEEIGRNIVTGLGQGIQNGIAWITGVAANLGKSVLDAAKHALGIASPSKEFFAVGMYINEGLANGVDTYAKISKRSVSDVANDTISIMSDAASKISGAMDNSTSYSPSITPVLDLSEIQNGSKQIDSMMAGYNSNVSGSIEFGAYSASQLQSIGNGLIQNQESQFANSTKLDSVVTKLSDIGSRIATLEGNLPGYIYDNTPSQVVMDGTKVGKMVAPTVNIEMGISQVRENRGL